MAEPTITAEPVNQHGHRLTCAGCQYQIQHGQRKHANLAEYRCDHCRRPLCKEHINYEEGPDWWLCAKCLTTYERKTGRR